MFCAVFGKHSTKSIWFSFRVVKLDYSIDQGLLGFITLDQDYSTVNDTESCYVIINILHYRMF